MSIISRRTNKGIGAHGADGGNGNNLGKGGHIFIVYLRSIRCLAVKYDAINASRRRWALGARCGGVSLAVVVVENQPFDDVVVKVQFRQKLFWGNHVVLRG